MTTAFVLSGGAALGAVQVGMLQALETARMSGRSTQPGSQVTQLMHTSTIWKPSGYRYGAGRCSRPVRQACSASWAVDPASSINGICAS